MVGSGETIEKQKKEKISLHFWQQHYVKFPKVDLFGQKEKQLVNLNVNSFAIYGSL